MADETLTVRLEDRHLEALDAWIARHEEPRPTREEAIRQVLSGALGCDSPSTIVPNLVTGRDIL